MCVILSVALLPCIRTPNMNRARCRHLKFLTAGLTILIVHLLLQWFCLYFLVYLFPNLKCFSVCAIYFTACLSVAVSQIAYMCPFTAFTVCIKRFTLTNTVPVSVGLCSGPNTEWHSVHFLLAVTAVLVICRRRTGGTKQGGYFLINTNGDSNICKIPCVVTVFLFCPSAV